ncbi:hypothetical protein [Criblamydia sequanensis]|uniref:Conserved putative secreted protein n=1 Tax=Candidatus Criblamydia sequanensis CRIB-18 TaxID=1437425 RepID=A0A090D063_9BACT|nr:hypothetical protein [Criblamydia sequanensis]CDR34872.1 Conserved putative secreted protein [Criblamydia sequanensis CRIB-18]
MRYKSSLKLLAIIVSFLIPSVSLASCCFETLIQLGVFSAHQGKSQHVDIEDLIGDQFTVDKHSGQNLLFGLGAYLEGLRIRETRILYGINAFYLAPTKVKGKVIQEDLFANLSYQYYRSNYPIYLATRALIGCCSSYDLILDLGLGVNIASTHGFKERSLDGGITESDKIFSGKTKAAFSATAGLGWRFNHLFRNFSLEIDYRFFYLGEGKLKRINSQVINSLSTGNSYANALFFTISI